MSDDSAAKRAPILRNPWIWAFLAGAVVLTALRPLLRHVPEPPPVLGHVPAWELTDASGAPFGSAELRGQVYIVSFFFTRCPSICPALMRGMARLQEGFDTRGDEGIRLVSVSVDPERDTPEVLRAYAEANGVHSPRWTLVTGDVGSVRRLVVDGLKTPMGDAPVSEGPPIDIAHSGKVVLVDGAGGIRGYYDTDELGLDEVYNRARHVRDEPPPATSNAGPS